MTGITGQARKHISAGEDDGFGFSPLCYGALEDVGELWKKLPRMNETGNSIVLICLEQYTAFHEIPKPPTSLNGFVPIAPLKKAELLSLIPCLYRNRFAK